MSKTRRFFLRLLGLAGTTTAAVPLSALAGAPQQRQSRHQLFSDPHEMDAFLARIREKTGAASVEERAYVSYRYTATMPSGETVMGHLLDVPTKDCTPERCADIVARSVKDNLDREQWKRERPDLYEWQPPPGPPRPDTALAQGGLHSVLRQGGIWRWLPEERRWKFASQDMSLRKMYVLLQRDGAVDPLNGPPVTREEEAEAQRKLDTLLVLPS